ncbi:hypothetical protein [Kaarinaea lacus]
MDIYVGNIPKGTRPGELQKLLKDSVKDRVFKRVYEQALALGRFDNDVEIKIVKRKHLTKRGYYRFGRISIPSDRIAPVALDSLKNSEIRGAKLEVRAFVERNEENDRRAPNWRELPWNGRTRRKRDRRETT